MLVVNSQWKENSPHLIQHRCHKFQLIIRNQVDLMLNKPMVYSAFLLLLM